MARDSMARDGSDDDLTSVASDDEPVRHFRDSAPAIGGIMRTSVDLNNWRQVSDCQQLFL
jgi:hypothetical protein